MPTGVPGVDGVVAVAAGYKRPLPRPAPLLVRVPAALSTEFYSLSFAPLLTRFAPDRSHSTCVSP